MKKSGIEIAFELGKLMPNKVSLTTIEDILTRLSLETDTDFYILSKAFADGFQNKG